ncbi:MAG TPA: glycosyltransferase family 87 protein, partial [Oligoflexia bacterium]|nr:glycosyltransferase family 87 protein [Oligoflexia bacterium]
PAGVLLTAPLGLISYDQAALIWFVFELCLLLAAASFVRRRFSLLSPGCCGLMLFTIFLAGAMPVSRSYISGQFSIAILFLSCLLYRSWLAGDSRGIGIWTGLALALKMFGWPIVFFLLIRRNWRALSTVFIVLVCSHILSWLLIGKDGLKSYYGEAVPAVIQSYRADGANLSLFGFGQRFFGGLRPPVRVDIAVPPLIDLPEAAPYAGAGIAAIVLFWVMLTCLKANRPETGPALLIALSAVFSPVVWLHGLSVMLIPLSVAFMFLQGLSFPSRHTAACAVLVFLFYCGDLFSKLLPGDGEPVSFALSLITLLPTVLVLVLMKYLAQLDAACGRKAASVQG